jgi:hypothetical protein
MNKRLARVVVWAALLAPLACSNQGSSPQPGGRTTAAESATKKEESPGSAKLASPEENYVAAAVKIGCLGIEGDDADKMGKERQGVLSAHGYTEESWIAAAKQFGAKSGDAVVKAMQSKCPG